ncbi:MAG: hypothetical protein AVDCRST_MAG33-740 [uncultured Thermomicrobiales bacterium]|uniref:Response regulatory domain-containing protein n=1 Tax=uncultured Thermomicrobiales bacterium TaxID=1645740 RepID=A0A6J4UIM8_9BACT|nr:MAG: hypothetical protein AVDCRST_MAG33-740 [uncultured Thermomicrobiales bacterium]
MSDASADRRHIFVINDVPDILNLFVDLLGGEGYQVTTDIFSLELSRLLTHVIDVQPDLVILDLMVAQEALGWQLLQMMKMDRSARAIPVIICTGAAQKVAELSTHLTAMNVATVLKPFDIDHLFATIDNVWVPNTQPND